MVSALNSESSRPDYNSSPGRGRCVVFLGKILCSYSDSTSLHLGS